MDSTEESKRELPIMMFGFPTPNWKQTWTVEAAERELKGFKFTGIGWYITASDVMLVIPGGELTAETKRYEFCVWDSDPRQLFGVIASVSEQTPVPLDEAIRSSWPALTAATEEIIAYVKGCLDESSSKPKEAEERLHEALGLEGPFSLPKPLPDEAPVMIPARSRHSSNEEGIAPHYHIGDFQMLIVSAEEHDEFLKRPEDLRIVPTGDGRYIAVFPSQHG